MNFQQLRAMLWMRWRVVVNGARRAKKLNNALVTIVLGVVTILCLLSYWFALVVGIELMEEASSFGVIMVWVALGCGFLFGWMIGLITDLQRSDSLSYKNLLHLPVSLGWVFIYNYLGSFVSISMGLFLPAMLGLATAAVVVDGPRMLICFPLVAGFIGVITALTYQLRSWLARLMEDKRKGRNVVTVITIAFVMMLQVPNMMNMSGGSSYAERRVVMDQMRVEAEQRGEETDDAELYLQVKRLEKEDDKRVVDLICKVFPLGWMPYGISEARDGRLAVSGLCAFGLLLLTALSLRRSYRTSIAVYEGVAQAKRVSDGDVKRKVEEQMPREVDSNGAAKPMLVERRIPFVSDSVSAVATANLRSLTRAPEGKLMLLGPLILLGMLVLMLAKGSGNPYPEFRPLVFLGVTSMGLLSISNLVQNQFGLDRDGFRSYVLAPVPRHVILLGKNLGVAPIGLGGGLIALGILQFFAPLDLQHFAGVVFETVSAFMLICLIGNSTSIMMPMRLKANGAQIAHVKVKAIIWHTLSIFLIPLILSPLALPFVIDYFGGAAIDGWPVFAILHLVLMGLTFALYRWGVGIQGEWLQNREQKILDELTRV